MVLEVCYCHMVAGYLERSQPSVSFRNGAYTEDEPLKLTLFHLQWKMQDSVSSVYLNVKKKKKNINFEENKELYPLLNLKIVIKKMFTFRKYLLGS